MVNGRRCLSTAQNRQHNQRLRLFWQKDSEFEGSARPFENDEALEFWTKITALFGVDAQRGSNEHGMISLCL